MEGGSFSRRSILILIIYISANLLPSSAGGVAPVTEEQKVKLTLYYEALCPYCSNFIVNYLYKIFDGELDAIIDLKLSPYGNAKIRSNGTIVCQHGPWECLLNTVEACAIHAWPDLKDHFPFIYCVENLIYLDKYAEWETCFEKLDLDPKPVTECYSSGYGTKLELKYAAETNALQPPHKYVPWVTVDGQPLYDDYYYFIDFICKAYKGTKVPRVCLETSHNQIRTPKHRANRINPVPQDKPSVTYPVSYGEEKPMSTLSKISLAIMSWIRPVGMAASF